MGNDSEQGHMYFTYNAWWKSTYKVNSVKVGMVA